MRANMWLCSVCAGVHRPPSVPGQTLFYYINMKFWVPWERHMNHSVVTKKHPMIRRDFCSLFPSSKQSCGKKSILIEFVSNATVSYLLLCIRRRVSVPPKQEMWLQILSASKTLLKQLWRRIDLHLHHGPLWLFIKTVKSTPAQSHLYLYYISDIYIKQQVLVHLTFTSYIRWILGPVRAEIGEWVEGVSNLGFLSYS